MGSGTIRARTAPALTPLPLVAKGQVYNLKKMQNYIMRITLSQDLD